MSKPDKVTPIFNFPGTPFKVPVVEIVRLEKCSDSRNLSRATVVDADGLASASYVVPSDMFKIGDLAFVVDEYYVVDTDLPIFSFLNKRRRTATPPKSRRVMIRCEAINGNFSTGVCLPLRFADCFGTKDYKLGDNLIDELGIRPSSVLIDADPEAYEEAMIRGRNAAQYQAWKMKLGEGGSQTFKIGDQYDDSPTQWNWKSVFDHGASLYPPSTAGHQCGTPAPWKDRISKYQDFVSETAIFPQDMGVVYTTLALNGEAGELAEKIKKIIRDKKQITSDEIVMSLTASEHEGLVKEAGDVIWYITAFLEEIGSSLDEAITVNMEKLKSRRDRGVLSGSGDNR